MIWFHTPKRMGLGVIAVKGITNNTEILCDPVRTFSGQDSALLRKTKAYHIFFVDRDTYSSKDDTSSLHLVVVPFPSLITVAMKIAG